MKGITKIIIQGNLDKRWKDYFDTIEINYEDNTTILIEDIKDEAHLHGILNLIRDLNLVLISINSVENNFHDNIGNRKVNKNKEINKS
jgi:hypothetical protein